MRAAGRPAPSARARRPRPRAGPAPGRRGRREGVPQQGRAPPRPQGRDPHRAPARADRGGGGLGCRQVDAAPRPGRPGPPDRRPVLFRGQNLFARSEAELTRFRRDEVGFVFQLYNLLTDFSALENAMLPALIQRRPAAEARGAGGRRPPRGRAHSTGSRHRPGRAVGRRAAARRPGSGPGGPAGHHPGRRAHRQPRSQDERGRLRAVRAACRPSAASPSSSPPTTWIWRGAPTAWSASWTGARSSKA